MNDQSNDVAAPPDGAATQLTKVNRRTFLAWVGAGSASASALAAAPDTAAMPVVAAVAAAPAATPAPRITVNGIDHSVDVDIRTTLLDYLRDHLHLTGTKKGCDHGQCGACTVHVDGRRINSCLALAHAHAGDSVTTIEGLGQPGNLHPMQASFLAHDGYQCGYCTSGQIMSAVALMQEPCGKADADVRECMSGNLCRCGAYANIVAAIQHVRQP